MPFLSPLAAALNSAFCILLSGCRHPLPPLLAFCILHSGGILRSLGLGPHSAFCNLQSHLRCHARALQSAICILTCLLSPKGAFCKLILPSPSLLELIRLPSFEKHPRQGRPPPAPLPFLRSAICDLQSATFDLKRVKSSRACVTTSGPHGL